MIASLSVGSPLSVSLAFGEAQIALGRTTSLTYTVSNPNPGLVSGLAFANWLPAGLEIATPNGLSGSCGAGTITAVAGSSVVRLSGSTVDGGDSCTFTVNVTATSLGLNKHCVCYIPWNNGSTATTCATLSVRASLDIDASNKTDALTDGLLIIRYLFGLSGVALTNGAIGSTATRSDLVDIMSYLDAARPALDVDDNGIADALTDGLILIRYLFGLRGDSMIAGAVGPNATRTTSEDIETYIQSLLP